jgi:drug/metabolite transporter (DMT)-like permease
MSESQKGLAAAILSPIFLGMSPILGKAALVGGADPFTVAALRTALVVILLWGFYLIFWRQYIYIYTAGLIACIAIGVTNGIGSLFYYSGLDRLDASIAHLLNATYVIFVVILTRIDGAHVSLRTLLRVMVALLSVLLITGGIAGNASWLGVGLILGSAILFAGTVAMSQRILYEMPAQTVTLYVMTAMGGVVVFARLLISQHIDPLSTNALMAILALGLTTALSRLTLFLGVKGLGSLRTTLLAIAESAVAVSLAFIFLGESLAIIQWFGVVALIASLFMPADTQPQDDKDYKGMLPNVAGFGFHRIARAADKLTTQEIRDISSIIGPTDLLNTQEMNVLRDTIGEDVLQQLQEWEAETKTPAS